MFLENDASAKYRLRGGHFQLPMIFLWGWRGIEYSGDNPASFFSLTALWADLKDTSPIAAIGLLLMGTCMIRIYRNKTGELITKDVFSLTRHPMYHGMYLADMAHFFSADLSSTGFWVSWVIFTALILTAGWYQEKETLARWGEKAKAYYERTPRFVFEWLWFRR